MCLLTRERTAVSGQLTRLCASFCHVEDATTKKPPKTSIHAVDHEVQIMKHVDEFVTTTGRNIDSSKILEGFRETGAFRAEREMQSAQNT